MKNQILVTALLAATVLHGCGKSQDEEITVDTSTTAFSVPPLNDENILALLDATNKLEMQLGRIAADKASRAEVRAFAEKLVAAHRALSGSVDSVAQLSQIYIAAPNGDTSAMHAEHMRDALMKAGANGSVDSLYLAETISTHEATLQTLLSQKEKIEHDQLQLFLERLIPELEAHITEAKRLAGK